MVGFIWSAYRMVKKLNRQKVRTRRELPTAHCKPMLSMPLVGLRYLRTGLRPQMSALLKGFASGSPWLSHCWPIDIIPFVLVGPKRVLARRDSSMVSVANVIKQEDPFRKPFSILVRNQVDASANGRFLYLSSPCSFTFSESIQHHRWSHGPDSNARRPFSTISSGGESTGPCRCQIWSL